MDQLGVVIIWEWGAALGIIQYKASLEYSGQINVCYAGIKLCNIKLMASSQCRSLLSHT